jgi:signal transduction histidine kinase
MSQQPTKILLVEDNTGDAGLLRAAMADIGADSFAFELVHVTRLADAVQSLKEQKFDIGLLDLSLPDSGGLGTVTKIREADPEIPIVVMSGLSDERVAIEAMRAGAQDFLVKGRLDSAMLVRSINHAIERKRVETVLRRQREQIAALHEINLAITSTLELPAVIDRLLERIHRMLPEYSMTVRLLNKRTGGFEAFASWNLDDADWKRAFPEIESGHTQSLMETKAPFAVPDAINDPRTGHREFFERNGFVSLLGCPLIVKDELIGLLNFFTKKRKVFGDAEIEFLNMLAGQAAVAIQNCQFYQQIKEAHDALEKALEIKSVLIGVMAHELKNPIQLILGNANLLVDGMFGDLTPNQRVRVQNIEASGLELAHLIESAIDMARLDGGKMTLKVAEVYVRSLLEELRDEFEAAYQNKRIDLQVNLPTAEPLIKTDPVKLKEILRNLIENARKYTSEGRVTVNFGEISGNRVEFIVTDTGRGIPSDLLPKIFDLFYQEDASHREYASAGLGLNIVKRLVSAMSGEITVTSEVGKGSTFRVTLPTAIESPAAQTARSA